MPDLYLARIQPNPYGKDAYVSSALLQVQLNNEWVEFDVQAKRNIYNDVLSHNTYTSYGCSLTGTHALVAFANLDLTPGQRVRVHTGSGIAHWEGNLLHIYLGKNWYIWNNQCGDRAMLSYSNTVIDWAEYGSNPREGILTRVPYSNRFI